ncbi:kelch repeat-containing protein [Hymenobacter sp. CRA2]|uniref:Kelch repeat-containing protein n=1 Tax=Hymenobacter sp. CRA2 TaxID=1955620 RepID=UPI00098EADCF|nr:kelch repeat-containing protein [Hymenobacter sp. CRA2]OON67443.1 hypothetical protein B0919_18440 [Hymenobacter sp. CRA2]
MTHISTTVRTKLASLLLAAGVALPSHAQVPSFTWATMAPAPLGRYEALGTVAEGRLYVFGGFYTTSIIDATARCDVYDPATNTWTQLANMPEAMTHTGLAYDGAGHLYMAGGYVGRHPGPITEHVWRYDIATNTWSAGVPLPSGRGGCMLVARGRTLHVFGGAARFGGVSSYDIAEHLTLDLDAPNPTWVARAPLPNPRNHLGGVALNGKVYAIGGQHLDNETTENQASVHEYDPATDTWTAKANMPRTLGHITSTVLALNNRIVVVAGVTNIAGAVPNLIEFDPVANTWREITPLPERRHSPVAGVVGGRLLVTGGTYTQLHTETWQSAQVLSAASPLPLTLAGLYPNPARTTETVQLTWPGAASGPVQVEIVDALGRVRHRAQYLWRGAQAGTLATTGLGAGLYTVRLQQGRQSAAARLVIQ